MSPGSSSSSVNDHKAAATLWQPQNRVVCGRDVVGIDHTFATAVERDCKTYERVELLRFCFEPHFSRSGVKWCGCG